MQIKQVDNNSKLLTNPLASGMGRSQHRLDRFISQLSQVDTDELENAADNSEVYNKYSEAEMKFYADTHKVSGEERASQAYDFLQSLEQGDSEFESDYSRE